MTLGIEYWTRNLSVLRDVHRDENSPTCNFFSVHSSHFSLVCAERTYPVATQINIGGNQTQVVNVNAFQIQPDGKVDSLYEG